MCGCTTKYSIGRAGPGVLFGGIVAAILVKFTFPYNWSWIDALLFGAITAATDPVAVVAVLKEVCVTASALSSPTNTSSQCYDLQHRSAVASKQPITESCVQEMLLSFSQKLCRIELHPQEP